MNKEFPAFFKYAPDDFPFTVYRAELAHYEQENRTEPKKLLCRSCQQECGHLGTSLVTTEYVSAYVIRKYEVIGIGTEGFFIQYDDGYSSGAIGIIPFDHTYFDRLNAEIAVKVLQDNLENI